jgi:hypothetical protein
MVANPRILRGCKQKIAACESRFFYGDGYPQCRMFAHGTTVACQRLHWFSAFACKADEAMITRSGSACAE